MERFVAFTMKILWFSLLNPGPLIVDCGEAFLFSEIKAHHYKDDDMNIFEYLKIVIMMPGALIMGI